ncbi:hypothetical protein FOD75_11470 (plasmid) [Limosilactobacillus reuteri]|uniref:Uncharacterized protein n=1 Tax=Limosilactobacillus reuteri TaxID=1598 RepID=A0A517D8L9_LIMRT|nr:hypothetical protein [Limosilactobacillus reuteri]QDR73702.1 hypothetical protein FOD75_11470 [Limosilactobacillus reuteri]
MIKDYFAATYDDDDYRLYMSEIVKSRFKKAWQNASDDPEIAARYAQDGINLVKLFDFHHALIDTLTDEELHDVDYYACNFVARIEGQTGDDLVSLWERGWHDEAISYYKNPYKFDRSKYFAN